MITVWPEQVNPRPERPRYAVLMERRILVLTFVALVGCGPGDEAAPALEAEEVVRRASAAMAAMESASFEMEVRGAPVEIEGLRFAGARGDYSAPASAAAVLEMRVGTATFEMSTIAVGSRTWLTDPLTGTWSELPTGLGFNPAIVFGSEGWVSLLTKDLDGAAVGSRDGNYLLAGSVGKERVELLTGGIVADQQVSIELVIDSDTFHVLKAEFSTESDQGTSDWYIELSNFDRGVTIEPPVTG